MADWVHCNNCYLRPGGGKKFVLTNCGHIFCDDCSRGSPDNCKVCGNRYNSMVLSSQMKPDVEQFFIEPAEHFNKFQKQFLQILEFQKSHREPLKAYADKKEAAFQEFQRKSTSKIKELEREVAGLKEENSKLRRLLASGSKPGTPTSANRLSPATALKRGHSPLTPGHQFSPYGRSTPNTSFKDKLQQWQQVPRTPAGPARLSVRTPPSNGMMGRPRGTPSANTQLLQRPGSAGGTPGTTLFRRASSTPGNREASPMAVESPSKQLLNRSSTPGAYSRLASSQPLPSNYTPGNQSQLTQPMSSQPVRAPSLQVDPQSSQPSHGQYGHAHHHAEDGPCTPSQLDPARRQIQLRYQPRSLLTNKQAFVTTPAQHNSNVSRSPRC